MQPGSAQSPRDGNSLLIAYITSVEILSGAFRRHREGTVTSPPLQAIRLLLHRHLQREYRTVRLTTAVLARAEYLLGHHPLRAYDAVQLASALEGQAMLTTASLPTINFVSSDLRLLAATVAQGLAIMNPNAQP